MNQRTLALIALSVATLIYGVTFTIAKEVMPMYIKPFGFIVIRVGGAAIVFWTLGLFINKKSTETARKIVIEKSDYKKISIAAFFGVGLNMLTFFKGLSYTTPISASVMMVTAPILVLIFSSIILKERLVLQKIIGIIIGLIGAIILIVYGSTSDGATKNMMFGNFLVFINAASYGMYLVQVKKIIGKYHPIVFVKWLYLFGLIFVLPFGFLELIEIQWQVMPISIYLKAGFVVLFTTCITYLCNLFALVRLKPTTVSVFIYLQPVIAAIYALLVGSDSFDTVKIMATLLIFLGVFLVSKQVVLVKNK
ncbi:DMT family transporter [Tenacibaculum piscium]|uniref:DMT family transporter n=1 Tax=Tenacibaculum piscium TaxID=1458515 RepID=UPI001F3929AD|nr:DMT family transporter [Tenacibaculum piscium]